MPTKKKAAKPAPRKKTAKPVKTAPKKTAKAGSKAVKQVKSVKKAVIKKNTAIKAKKATPKPSKVVKKASSKPVKKKTAPVKPVKKAEVKKSAKPTQSVKVVVKPAVKKAESKPVVKKAVTPVPAKPTTIKPPVQQAIKDMRKAEKQPAKPVVVKPVKTTTKASVKYQPDFTKSVLDANKSEAQQGPLVRYSDAELQEFKELILRKLEASKKELVYLQGVITRKDESGGDDADGRYITMEDGSISMEREQLSQMASRQITYIDHLEKALMRIENKTYGVCRMTGKLIDKARLRAVPHATLSMEAKLGQHKVPQGE